MATIIPFVPGEPEQRISIALDSETYVLRARWNSRDSAWYLDAWERDGITAIVFGVKLVLGTVLGRTVQHPLFISGMFMVDESGTGAEAGLLDLGGRVNLYHLTVADRVIAGQPP